ncbi:cyclase family protein [Actinomadura kijaniata]|uniref:cyclase family protein n=1 Tax=Actinomadura kijaniata TaxID=46161 RepID=UPI0008307731|nr:cyclase family protein [Actinomadura kijaniata]
MGQYRASFDATVSFGNGGDLAVRGFRVDVPGPDVTEEEIGALFVASLGLLMSGNVELSNVEVFEEAHKGTRGGPSDRAAAVPRGRLVELGHVIRHGMRTAPGLPAPEVSPFLTREASREVYAPGTEFAIDRIHMVGSTGTYLDTPYHRYADGADLTGIPLEKVVDLPAVVVRVTGTEERAIDVGAFAAFDVRGRAVLVHTGDAERFGTPAYADKPHHLTRAAAAWLVDNGAALVGIDAVNVDTTDDPERPVHTLLLGAGIPIVENMTGLEQLPPSGASLTAVPLRIAGLGMISVRAFARLPE